MEITQPSPAYDLGCIRSNGSDDISKFQHDFLQVQGGVLKKRFDLADREHGLPVMIINSVG
jgi:hypothetical protein